MNDPCIRFARHAAAAALAAALAAAPAGAAGFVFVSSEEGKVAEVRWGESDTPRVVRVHRRGDGPLVFPDRATRGYLGVHVVELTPELREHLGADRANGLLVARVEKGSPAEAAGLSVGDVLLEIDGQPIASSWDLRRAVAPHGEGDQVAVEVVRDGRRLSLRAALESRKARAVDLGYFFEADGEELRMKVPHPEAWTHLGKELGHVGAEVAEAMASAMANLDVRLDDPQLRLRIEERIAERQALEEKVRQLERRLKELERRLAERR
ncbi:MAG TPA: PDZ domain-containing protein [Thermoanaerobaculia bacterium]|nr:PDZ domain-containing protein [Thermoanaerobaculia bacterium]